MGWEGSRRLERGLGVKVQGRDEAGAEVREGREGLQDDGLRSGPFRGRARARRSGVLRYADCSKQEMGQESKKVVPVCGLFQVSDHCVELSFYLQRGLGAQSGASP